MKCNLNCVLEKNEAEKRKTESKQLDQLQENCVHSNTFKCLFDDFSPCLNEKNWKTHQQ